MSEILGKTTVFLGSAGPLWEQEVEGSDPFAPTVDLREPLI
jgi:hypothetical protein